MEWFRHHPKWAAAAAALATVFVIVAVWVVISPSDETDPSAAPEPSLPTRSPLTELPTVSPSATPTKKATNSAQKQFAQTLKDFQNGTGSGGGSVKGGTLNMPGLQGGSMYKYLPKHHIVLRVTSQAPIGTVGYIMPTSLNESSGVNKNVGTAWSISSTVYGDPDYAQIFVQAGARGYPVTCTITVDGNVTERRSTEGPYGQMLCQG